MLGEYISEGSFGKVGKGEYNGITCAVKILLNATFASVTDRQEFEQIRGSVLLGMCRGELKTKRKQGKLG